ncbi:MAG: citrate/2-methylcitrate synthase [Pseudomonadota bacterium]
MDDTARDRGKATANDHAYMDARQAMAHLNVQHQTLYAYVSRGLVRSFRQPGKKSNLYLREDIERLKARAEVRSGQGVIAASAMQFGEPIVPTSITEISPEGPRYRGLIAVDLAARQVSFESVAELLWTGLSPDEGVRWDVKPLPAEVRRLCESLGKVGTREQFMEVFALVVLTLGISRGGVAQRLRSGNTLDAAKQVLQVLVGCLGLLAGERRFTPLKAGDSMVQGVLRALGGNVSDENSRAIEAILVLLADHELAPASFASRVAASSGSSLHGCLVSAMCTHAGVKVGHVYDQAEVFLAGARTRAALLRRVTELRDQGRKVPGFAHPLYPKGDPRAACLLRIAAARSRHSVRLREFMAFIDTARTELNLLPQVELVVTALCNEMGLPRESGGALFAIARSAGWVAHILEQRLSSVLLRPRAKFVNN